MIQGSGLTGLSTFPNLESALEQGGESLAQPDLRPHQRLSDLANHTSSDISALSRVVGGLIKRGLAQRDRSSEDARAIAVSLTAEGIVLTEKIIPLAQVYERVALAGITDEEATLLRHLLRKIYDNINILDR